MIITTKGLNPTGLWAGNMDVISISGITEDIRVSFRISNSTTELGTMSERYSPINSVVRITKLGEIARVYMERPAITGEGNLYSIEPIIITATVFSLSGTELKKFSQKFFFSSIPTPSIPTPGNYPLFLSRFHRRSLKSNQWDFISFIAHGQRLVYGIAYGETKLDFGTLPNQPHYKEIEIPVPADNKIQIHTLSPAAVVSLLAQNNIHISPEQLLLLDVSLFMDEAKIDSIHFEIDHRIYSQRVDFIYFNLFGCPEGLVCTGRSERSADLGAIYLPIANKYQKVRTNLVVKHNVNTGCIDAAYRDAIYDLVTIEPVYQIIQDEPVPITVLEVDLAESEPKTEPINLKITYRVSEDDRQQSFHRKATQAYSIFDKTFDSSFN